MRAVTLIALLLPACVELGVVSDGTSISVGKPSRGRIIEGTRMPDRGEGFVTRDTWKLRGVRYGTDELVDLLTAVSRRMATKVKERLVIADLSWSGGGAAHKWHASHQSGRDVDLLYYVRDRDGKPAEADEMRVFDSQLRAKDGSGYTLDVARNWLLVREFLTAAEAPVQWVFMYQPIANKLVEHAISIGEPVMLVERARKALKQPGNRAPHSDHMHVRVYCSSADRAYGCIDMGPMELMQEREAEFAPPREPAAPAPLAPASPATASVPGASNMPMAVPTQMKSIVRLLRKR
jgi:penicillin-insensitive murein endopeptidase